MKNITSISAFVLIFLLLLLSIGLNIRQQFKQDEKDSRLADLISTSGKNTVNERYVKDSVTHTVFNEKVISNNLTEKQLALGKPYADSLEKSLKVSISRLDQATKINAALEAKLALKESPNTSGKKVLSHTDKFLQLRYYPDTDSVDLAMDIKLNEARYKKRSWFLGKEESFVDVFADDPRVKINGLKSFTLKGASQKRFGIGLQAGYGLGISNNTLQPIPFIGLGLNYNLIEF